MDTYDSASAARQALGLLEESIGFVYPAALGAAVRLGVADLLDGGPRTAAELAEATVTDATSLHRVLRLLVTRGILGEDEHGRFHLTPRGELLRTNAPLSMRDAIVNVTAPLNWLPVGELLTGLREGTPAFESVFGAPFFEHLAKNPQQAAVFHSGMASITQVYEAVLAAQLELPKRGTVVDVGGGFGGLLLRILRQNEGLHGVLFDQQHVLQRHRLGELGDDDRWEVAAGDFFTEVPSGADVYVIKAVLHDWPDEQCETILRNCKRAMAPGGRILVIEDIIEPGDEPDFGTTLDVLMMVLVAGRERTQTEFAALLSNAGLRIDRIMPTDISLSVIEAVCP